MASATSAKPKKGTKKLIPCYVGITDGQDAKGVKTTHTHYVLIDSKVASRIGIKGASVKKPGGSDAVEHGVVYQTNRKKAKGTGKVEAKRYLSQGKRKIKLYCKGTVKDKQNKQVQETYSVGFPLGVPLRLIKKFLQDHCPNVVRYGTGNELYQVR